VGRRGSHIFLDNWLTDCGEVVSLTRRPHLYHQEDSWYSFLSRPQGHSAGGRLRSIEKSNDLIGNRTRDLPACIIVPPTETYCHKSSD
jgi:hypothetical protein